MIRSILEVLTGKRTLRRANSRERSDLGECGGVLRRLADGENVTGRAVVVAAHPDDETIGMGSRLAHLTEFILVHATDGSSGDLRRISEAGFATAKDYSAARFRELDDALEALGAKPRSHLRYNFVDRQLIWLIPDLVNRLEADLAGASIVLSHAYEGGHPDHDACALAVQLVCERLTRSGRETPPRLEFSGYHSRRSRFRSGEFWADSTCPTVTVRLSHEERIRKRNAIRAFRSQTWIYSAFGTRKEVFRQAPRYDFRSPPPPGAWFYDKHGWELKGEVWLRQARIAVEELSVG